MSPLTPTYFILTHTLVLLLLLRVWVRPLHFPFYLCFIFLDYSGMWFQHFKEKNLNN